MAGLNTNTNNEINKKSLNNSENKENNTDLSFTIFDICCIIFSMGTFVADLTTDIILIFEYWRRGHLYFAVSTLILVLVPAGVIQLFSMRWHLLDEAATKVHWIAHCLLLGVAQRYVIVLNTGVQARSSRSDVDFQRLRQQQSDICMLHLFGSFLEDAPQLVLQLYVIASFESWHIWTGISAGASLCSLAWSLAAYTRAMRKARTDKKHARWEGLLFQAIWRGGMISARITALVLLAVGFRQWVFVLLSCHWLIMTTWVIKQNTDFCQSPLEERFYNCVVGVIYCFCFFNLREGRTRYRMLVFYSIMIPQNIICLVLYVLYSGKSLQNEFVIIAAVLIIAGTILGLTSMFLYYGCFHPVGKIRWNKTENKNMDNISPITNVVSDGVNNSRNTLKSSKRYWIDSDTDTLPNSIENSPQSDVDCTDKKLLLDNWIARSGSPTFASVPILDQDVEFHTVTNSPEKHNSNEGFINSSFEELNENLSNKLKRRGICSPIELGLKLNELQDNEEIFIEEAEPKTDLLTQKRRGICSSTQLEQYNDTLENPLECETATTIPAETESIKKRRPICTTSDLTNIEIELSLESEILSAKNKDLHDSCTVKITDSESVQSLENESKVSDETSMSKRTLSEILSAHDYENICAVNIAREIWGLRSWRGYCDIETWLHDDSVVADYRSHIASTVTSASSEISSNEAFENCRSSPPPLPRKPLSKSRSRQDDYIDTLVYDLASCENGKRIKLLDYQNEDNVFVAKPYVVDQNGGMFPLCLTLEPIKEELEETFETSDHVSSLVATIDEIRRDTSANSPRHVYHRTENVLESPIIYSNQNSNQWRQNGRTYVLPKALWQNFSPQGSGNELPLDVEIVQQLTSRIYENHSLRIDKLTESKILPDEKVNFLSQLKLDDSDTELDKIDSNTNSYEPIISSSLQSLVSSPSSEDILSIAEIAKNFPLTRKSSRPRRKFSLIRDRFEVKERKRDSTEVLINENSCSKICELNDEKLDKENVIPLKDKYLNCDIFKQNDEKSHFNDNNEKYIFMNMTDKRSVFLNQVLSPPKMLPK